MNIDTKCRAKNFLRMQVSAWWISRKALLWNIKKALSSIPTKEPIETPAPVIKITGMYNKK